MEYSRNKNDQRQHFRGVSSGHADWVCEQCGAVNFARRVRCYTCTLDKPVKPRMAADVAPEPQLPDADLEGRFDADEPTPCLVVYGLSKFSGEPELANAMRAYAPVKDVKLLRDSAGRTRGVGFVTFHTVQASAHTLQTASGRARVDGQPVKLAYTKGAALAQVIATAALQQQPAPPPRQQPRQQPVARHHDDPYRRRRRSPSSGEESDGQRRRQPAAKLEWPPPFEANTAAFAFDPASRYFYEPQSGFYYDPKTKVYYNAHTKQYFYHTPNTTPPFTRFDHPAHNQQPADDAAKDAAAAKEAAAAAKDAAKQRKKKRHKEAPQPKEEPLAAAKAGPIVFGLAKPGAASAAPAASGLAAAAKRVAPAFAASHVVALGSDYDQLHRLVVDNKPCVRHCPTSGKWMCLVSRRQFDSEDKLKRHVAKSQLYKDALEKAAHESRIVVRQPA